MIDLHTHVLPEFDDGATDWQMAVSMCRQAAGDGITQLVATPHFHRGIFPTPTAAAVETAVEELRRLCKKGLIDNLEVLMGSDCHIFPELPDNLRSGNVPTINGSRYLLLELTNDTLPPRLDQFVFDVSLEGVTPIITHPERNEVLAKHPEILYGLVQGGVYAQVTAGSLTGGFGSSVRRTAEMMVSTGLVQMIASDAHDPDKRPPMLSEARGVAARLIGDDLAQRMVEDVPREVLEDRPIRYPEPMPERPRRRSFWRRLLGR